MSWCAHASILAMFGWAIPVWGLVGLILAAILAWILPRVFGE
jgi:hypothetical protein